MPIYNYHKNLSTASNNGGAATRRFPVGPEGAYNQLVRVSEF